jgi:hypothetical protein
MRSLCIIISLAFLMIDMGYAQEEQQDVIILKDSTIIRGSITKTVTPGSAVTVRKLSGRVTSVLWSEILMIRKLPVSMPDSAISVLYLGSPGKKSAPVGISAIPGAYSSPSGQAPGDTTMEDVLALADGRIVRGWLVESSQKGSVGLWTHEKKLMVVQREDIRKSLHLEKGMSDSAIDVMYIHPRPEMIADDFRIFTLFGGFSAVGGDLSSPSADGAGPVSSGYALGVHASVRILPPLRWATTAIYGRHPMDLPEVAKVWTSLGPGPFQMVWVLTGAELRTEGTAALKEFVSLQGGILYSKFGGVDFTIPQTFYHLPGTGSLQGASGSSFALCIGGGISMGRFSLVARWLSSAASYQRNMTINLIYQDPAIAVYRYDQHVSVFIIGLGFTPI